MILATATQSAQLSMSVAAEKSSGGGITPLLLLLGLGGFTYLILVRPQRKRMKQLQQTQASLSPGAEVMTTAGLYATVVDFDDETVTLETAPGVHNRYVRAAVARLITPVDDASDDYEDEPDDESADDPVDEPADDEDQTPEEASPPGR